MSLQQSDYQLSKHTRWERALHGALSLMESRGLKMGPDERSQIVLAFCQNNPQTSNEIVYCEFCEESKAEHLLNGTDPHAFPDECRTILEKWGYVRLPKVKHPHQM